MKKRIHHVAKKARENPEAAFRVLVTYVTAAFVCSCMARAAWRGENPGMCCDKIPGASASVVPGASASVRTVLEEK